MEFTMKKLLILLLLNLTLFAQTPSHNIPAALEKKLCGQLANNDNRCENGSTLTYVTHAKLNDDKLLLFVYLNDHHQKINDPKSSIAIVIDKYGRWISTVGNNIIGENIKSIHQDPHGHIWIRTLWETEGLSPAFYHSNNGLKWQQTLLPKNRNIDCCFETVDVPIFLYNSITLTFRNLENTKVKSWTANYRSAMSNNPLWQPIIKVPSSGIEIIQENSWKMTKSKRQITFYNPNSKKKIFLPLQSKHRTKIYQIQIAAFSKNSSIQKVNASFKDFPYKLETIKGKKYLKVVIGRFTRHQKAKALLVKLKKEYPKNRNIQNAFILTSTP